MYNVKHGGEVHRGDIVAISCNNTQWLGIYFGNGAGGTFQYFTLRSPGQYKYWFEKHKETKEANGLPYKPWSIKWIRKDYLQSPHESRIIKLNRDNITDPETLEHISEAKEILSEFNITVNF